MSSMFAKVFSQIFDSSIAEDYKIRHIFMDLLVMADSDGVVDKTPEAIARVANVPLDEVLAALKVLAQPDLKSRTNEQDGRRIVPIDNHREWGWQIVNFQKYRDIRDEEARRIANRSYKRDERARKRQQVSASIPDNQQSQPRSAHTEEEVEVDLEVKSKSVPPPGFHPLNYGRSLCVELGIPLKGNLEMLASAVEAVMNKNECDGPVAHQFLLEKAREAEARGEKVDRWWFQDAKWKGVKKRVSKRDEEFQEAIERSREAD